MNIVLLKRLGEASRDGDVNEFKLLMVEALLDGFEHVVPKRARDSPLHIAASNGHINFTSEVLRVKPQLAEMRNSEGRLPLHLAIPGGHLQVVEKLLDQKNGQNFCLRRETKCGYMPAHVAAANGEHPILKKLVEKCSTVLDKTTPRDATLLHLAVMANCIDSVRYLIDQGVKLNEKDVDGNTCLHLACHKRNHQVITYLLDQEGIEVNATNARGLTPLDVLWVSSWDSTTEISLVDVLRRAGGQGATELGNLQSNLSNSRNISKHMDGSRHQEENAQAEAQTLLVVATLVATMTYPAILSPPGGFIQLPYDKQDHTWSPFGVGGSIANPFVRNWTTYGSFPAGRPVLLWQLSDFLMLDSMALFSSITVILILLCGTPKSKIIMKILGAVVWMAVFCTGLAFASVFLLFYDPGSTYLDSSKYFDDIAWVFGLVIAWSVVFGIASLWASFQVFRFLWKKGGF